MFTYSQQEKIIAEFIKMTILNIVNPQLFFWLVVYESLVCPEQLNCLLFFRKIPQVPQILRFSRMFVYLNPLQQ